jgi:hypothetical protein
MGGRQEMAIRRCLSSALGEWSETREIIQTTTCRLISAPSLMVTSNAIAARNEEPTCSVPISITTTTPHTSVSNFHILLYSEHQLQSTLCIIRQLCHRPRGTIVMSIFVHPTTSSTSLSGSRLASFRSALDSADPAGSISTRTIRRWANLGWRDAALIVLHWWPVIEMVSTRAAQRRSLRGLLDDLRDDDIL